MKGKIVVTVALVTVVVTVAFVTVAAFRVRVPCKESAAVVPDIAAEARNVFEAKCAGCHGPDLAEPEGRFGYILDLRRIAGNPEMVIPFSPDESELWVLARNGEMPPADSPQGPLTDAEKEIIRKWISAGAPVVAPR